MRVRYIHQGCAKNPNTQVIEYLRVTMVDDMRHQSIVGIYPSKIFHSVFCRPCFQVWVLVVAHVWLAGVLGGVGIILHSYAILEIVMQFWLF